jgi:hypothetical protein
MNSEAGIYYILKNDATLIAMLASATSIYPEAAPQSAANPCIVYSESTPEFSDTHSGVSKLDINLIQVDVYAQTVAARNLIGARVRLLLDRYSGTVNDINIQSIQLIYQYKTIEPQFDGSTAKIYRQTFDFRLRQYLT